MVKNIRYINEFLKENKDIKVIKEVAEQVRLTLEKQKPKHPEKSDSGMINICPRCFRFITDKELKTKN